MPETWIRFEAHGRYHAVFEEAGGLVRTWCDRWPSRLLIRDETQTPVARCQCCRGRIAHPYLAPENTHKGEAV